MQIDLLYFDGCPAWEDALENLKAALAAEGLQADVHLVRVKNEADAERLKFLGSPSFRVNGTDLWHEESKRYNLSCHVYTTLQGMRGVPTVEMLLERLHGPTFNTSITA